MNLLPRYRAFGGLRAIKRLYCTIDIRYWVPKSIPNREDGLLRGLKRAICFVFPRVELVLLTNSLLIRYRLPVRWKEPPE